MTRLLAARLVFARLVLPAAARAADAAPPLVDLPVAGSLPNEGALGGEAALTAHAPAEAAVFDEGAIGWCLDRTAASRHGGVLGVDTSPAGSSVVFKHEKLAARDEGAVVGRHRVEIRTGGEGRDADGNLTETAERVPARYHATSELLVEVAAGDNTRDFPLVTTPEKRKSSR